MPTDDREDRRRQRLDRLRAQIEEGLQRRDLAADGDDRGDGHHHPAEVATDAEQRERDLRNQLSWQRRRERLERALVAIEAGTYGVCVACGQEIAEGRLQALPDAERCVDCARSGSAAGRRAR